MLPMRLIVREERMRKAFIILTGIIFTLLFSACKQFTADIDDYLGYWSSEAFILSSEIDKETHNDRSGMTSVASADDVTVTLKVRNPRSFRFVMPSPSETRNIVEFAHFSGTKPAANNQYEMKQLSADTLQLVYKDSFLKNSEWGEKDISSTITLYADDGRVFKQTFTVPLKANTRPPKPRYVVAKTKGSSAYYVLCITVPDMDKKLQGDQRLHKDIKHIRINETEYTFSVNTAQTAFTKPDNEVFIMHDDIEKLGGSNADDVPTDSSWVLYYQTNVKVEVGTAKKDYTIRLVDEKGLVSEKLDASTNPNKPKIEGPKIEKGSKISENDSGSEAGPVRIGTDSSGAELSLSSAPASTKVHCTLTEIGSTESPTSYEGNPVTVLLPLKGAGEKNYKLEYYADGTGFETTSKKTVYYKILQEYTVTFSVASGEGKLQGAYGSQNLIAQNGGGIQTLSNVPHGTSITFTATPNTSNGYEVDSWSVGGDPVAGQTGLTYTLSNITGDTTVKVKFKQNVHTVTFNVEGEGGDLLGRRMDNGATLTANTNPKFFYNVPSGKQVNFTALPDNDWKVKGWTVSYGTFESGGGINTTATLKVTGDTTVTVKFYRSSIPNASTWKDLLLAVKNAPQNGTITIKNGTIKATNAADDHGEIVIDKDLTIRGDSLSVSLDANNLSRIFKVKEGKTLTLEKIKLKNGKVEATEEGGGVYNEGTLIMKEDSFIGGCEAGKGGGVYNNGTLIMEKDSWVTPSAGIEQYTAGKNDVYLKNGKMITVKGPWPDSPVARITLETYRKGVKVLTGSSSIVSANYKRFTVTPDSKTGMPWYIDADGNLNIDEVGVSNETELENAINGATDDKPRVITVTSNFDTIKRFVIPYEKNITIKDDGTRRTLTCKEVSGGHNHFEVQSGGKLTFRGEITLKGSSFSHGQSQYGLFVNPNGTAEIADNVIITGFINRNSAAVYTKGTLIMSGGTIKDNNAQYGGGVCIGDWAFFKMTGGTIQNNTAEKGGGVYMGNGTIFEMTGGTITSNTATTNGKAVWVNGAFKWKGGTITGNNGTGAAVHIHGGSCSPKPATDAS